MIARMIEAGVAVFRLNLSHGQPEEHERHLATVREVSARAGRPVAVLADLPGPKIRVGTLDAEGLAVDAGSDVWIGPAADQRVGQADPAGAGTAGPAVRDAPFLPCTYPALAQEVAPGHRVLIDDGAIRMLAVEASGAALRCRVLSGGVIRSGKGINVPDSELSMPAMSQRDWQAVEWAVHHGLDLVALSFVRRAADVLELRERLAGMCSTRRDADPTGTGARIPVVAKLERPQAVAELDAIVEAADALMIARGDLGVEMDLAQVPVVQKRAIQACHRWGKPCIVATQMLESMVHQATPTRAEASDVANSIFDGADAVMLSAETALGRHPDLVVETMRRIILAAEAHRAQQPRSAAPPAELVERRDPTAALAHGAFHVIEDVRAVLVACWSERGGTARYLSRFDLRVPVLAYCSQAHWTRQMALLAGVTPLHRPVPPSGRIEAWAEQVDRDVIEAGLARAGDRIVLVAGEPLGQPRATDRIWVRRVAGA